MENNNDKRSPLFNSNPHGDPNTLHFWTDLDSTQTGCVLAGLLLGMSLTTASYEIQSVWTTGESCFFGRHGTRLWRARRWGFIPDEGLKRGLLVWVVGLCLWPLMPVFVLYEVFLMAYWIGLWCWVLTADEWLWDVFGKG